MSPKQNILYWRRAADCRAAMKRYGRAVTTEEWETERKAIHAAAGAVYGGNYKTLSLRAMPKSSKDLTNAEFDGVLARFRAWSHPSDLNSQIRQESQPFTRWRWKVDELLDRIGAVLVAKERAHEAAPIARGPDREGYLLGMARRIGEDDGILILDSIGAVLQWKLMSALMVRYDQVAAKGRGTGGGRRPGGKPPRARPFDQGAQRPPYTEAPAAAPVPGPHLMSIEIFNDGPFGWVVLPPGVPAVASAAADDEHDAAEPVGAAAAAAGPTKGDYPF